MREFPEKPVTEKLGSGPRRQSHRPAILRLYALMNNDGWSAGTAFFFGFPQEKAERL
jgi:hypothetical protein